MSGLRLPFFGLIALALPLLLATAGCCPCDNEPTPRCESILTYKKANASGTTPFKGWGTGETKAEAISNSCWDYCYEADTNFDALYRISRDAAAKKGRTWPKDKKDALIVDKSLDEKFKKGCVPRCIKNVKANKDGFSSNVECGVFPTQPDFVKERNSGEKTKKKTRRRRRRRRK